VRTPSLDLSGTSRTLEQWLGSSKEPRHHPRNPPRSMRRVRSQIDSLVVGTPSRGIYKPNQARKQALVRGGRPSVSETTYIAHLVTQALHQLVIRDLNDFAKVSAYGLTPVSEEKDQKNGMLGHTNHMPTSIDFFSEIDKLLEAKHPVHRCTEEVPRLTFW